jgi:RNA recognition motif-containing protein
MKDRKTGQPRGFGFVTYADPSVVDQVIQDTHIINGKQVGFAVVLMLDLTAERLSLSFYFSKIQ